jgi:hypothetical protein
LTDDEGNDACDYAKANGIAEKLPQFFNCSKKLKQQDMAKLKRLRGGGDLTASFGPNPRKSREPSFKAADRKSVVNVSGGFDNGSMRSTARRVTDI